MDKIGVVIANTGSPAEATPEAVRAYLQDFLTDPRIRPMNPVAWKLILKAFILPRRSVASAQKYAGIWRADGSPLDAHMRALTAKLDAASGEQMVVRSAMSYGTPSMRTALGELREAGCDRLVVVPLYPQSAHSTTKVVQDKLEAALDAMKWEPAVRFVDCYASDDGYLDAIAGSVEQMGFGADDQLLMTFHSIPMRDIARGDTYAEQVHATTRALAKRLGLAEDRWAVGFQCRFDKSRKWLGPSMMEALESLAPTSGRLFVVAPNFSVDCLETLYDIDVVLKKNLAEVRPQQECVYVPCLNDSPAHVDVLRQMIESR